MTQQGAARSSSKDELQAGGSVSGAPGRAHQSGLQRTGVVVYRSAVLSVYVTYWTYVTPSGSSSEPSRAMLARPVIS